MALGARYLQGFSGKGRNSDSHRRSLHPNTGCQSHIWPPCSVLAKDAHIERSFDLRSRGIVLPVGATLV